MLLLTAATSVIVGLSAGLLISKPMRRLVDAARRLGDQRPLEFKPSLLREANVVAEELSRTSSHVHNIIGELTHRTKNLMAVVEAIARQTLRSATSSEDFQHRFAQRIAGLAVSHDLLVHRDWKGVLSMTSSQARFAPLLQGTKQNRLSSKDHQFFCCRPALKTWAWLFTS